MCPSSSTVRESTIGNWLCVSAISVLSTSTCVTGRSATSRRVSVESKNDAKTCSETATGLPGSRSLGLEGILREFFVDGQILVGKDDHRVFDRDRVLGQYVGVVYLPVFNSSSERSRSNRYVVLTSAPVFVSSQNIDSYHDAFSGLCGLSNLIT